MKVCIDKTSDQRGLINGLYSAYLERSTNLILEKEGEKIEIDSDTGEYLEKAIKHKDVNLLHNLSQPNQDKLIELALWRDKKWANGKTIRVKFLGGTQFLKDKVKENALTWTRFANINFDFVEYGDAEIRISFHQGIGSWSYIGVDCINITNQDEATMNYGWFNQDTPNHEFSRTVLHEFGHALGCIHEHQSPAASIPWDKPVVYRYYAATQGWSKDEVDNNLFAVYDNSTISNSNFDRNSIMLYPIDGAMTGGRLNVGLNNILSMNDIVYIRKWYPGR